MREVYEMVRKKGWGGGRRSSASGASIFRTEQSQEDRLKARGRGKAQVMTGDAIGNHGLRGRYEMGAAGVVTGGSQD